MHRRSPGPIDGRASVIDPQETVTRSDIQGQLTASDRSSAPAFRRQRFDHIQHYGGWT